MIRRSNRKRNRNSNDNINTNAYCRRDRSRSQYSKNRKFCDQYSSDSGSNDGSNDGSNENSNESDSSDNRPMVKPTLDVNGDGGKSLNTKMRKLSQNLNVAIETLVGEAFENSLDQQQD